MQFGVQFFPAVDHTDKSAAAYYAESLAIAEEADRLGFTHARTVEHYFTRYGGYSPNPIAFFRAVSQRPRPLRRPSRRGGSGSLTPLDTLDAYRPDHHLPTRAPRRWLVLT